MADDSASSKGVSRGDSYGTKSGTTTGSTSTSGGGQDRSGGPGGPSGANSSPSGSHDTHTSSSAGRGAGDIGAAGVPGGRTGGQQAPTGGGIAGISGGAYNSGVNGSRYGGASTQAPGAGESSGRGSGLVSNGSAFNGGFGHFNGPGVNTLNQSNLNTGRASTKPVTDRVPQASHQGIGSYQVPGYDAGARMNQLAAMPGEAFAPYGNMDPNFNSINAPATYNVPNAYATGQALPQYDGPIGGMSFNGAPEALGSYEPVTSGPLPGSPVVSISNYADPNIAQAGQIAFGNTTPFNTLVGFDMTHAGVPLGSTVPTDPRVAMAPGSFPAGPPAPGAMSYDNVMSWKSPTQMAQQGSLATRVGIDDMQAMADVYGPAAPSPSSIPSPFTTGIQPNVMVAGDPRVNMTPGSYPVSLSQTMVASDPRVGMPTGGFPAVGPVSMVGANSGQFADVGPLSEADIYAQNYGFVSPNVVMGNTPYVGTASDFGYWSKGFNPLSGTATAGTLASPSAAGTMVAGDPRVGLPTGGYPAAPSAPEMASFYDPLGDIRAPSFKTQDRLVTSAKTGKEYEVTPEAYNQQSPEMQARIDTLLSQYSNVQPDYTPPTFARTPEQQYAFTGGPASPEAEHILSVENVPAPYDYGPSQEPYSGSEFDIGDPPDKPTDRYIGPYSPYDDIYGTKGYTDYAQDRSNVNIRPTSGPPPSGGTDGGSGGGSSGGGSSPSDDWFNKYYNNPAYQTVVPTPDLASPVYTWQPGVGYILTPPST